MIDRKKGLSDQNDRQEKANKKVSDQEGVVRKMNGTATEHPEQQQLLNEMRGNKASLDLTRAMLDYDDEHRDEKLSRPSDRQAP